MARVDGERCEHGEHPLLVDLAHRLALGGAEIRPADDRNAGLLAELRQQLIEDDFALPHDESPCAVSDLTQLLLGRTSVGVGLLTFAATWSFSAATRTWKNSSRFDDVIAQNFARSSNGMPGSVASESTRSLNATQLSSRLMKRSSTFASVADRDAVLASS